MLLFTQAFGRAGLSTMGGFLRQILSAIRRESLKGSGRGRSGMDSVVLWFVAVLCVVAILGVAWLHSGR